MLVLDYRNSPAPIRGVDYVLVYGTLRQGMHANYMLTRAGLTRVLEDVVVSAHYSNLLLRDTGGFPFVHPPGANEEEPVPRPMRLEEARRVIAGQLGEVIEDQPPRREVADLILDDNHLGPVFEVWRLPQDQESRAAALTTLDRYEGVPTLYNRDVTYLSNLYYDGMSLYDVGDDGHGHDEEILLVGNKLGYVYTWADDDYSNYPIIPTQDWARRNV